MWWNERNDWLQLAYLSAGNATIAGLAPTGNRTDPQGGVQTAVAGHKTVRLVAIVSSVNDAVKRLFGGHIDDHVAAFAASGHRRIKVLTVCLQTIRTRVRESKNRKLNEVVRAE